jgi:hypothetical protein
VISSRIDTVIDLVLNASWFTQCIDLSNNNIGGTIPDNLPITLQRLYAHLIILLLFQTIYVVILIFYYGFACQLQFPFW